MNSQIKTKSRRKYDADFKVQVLKMLENGKSVTEVAQGLGIGENLIYRWKNATKLNSRLDKREKNENTDNLMIENQALRERIKQMEIEQTILKKSLGHFQPPDLKLVYEHVCELSALFPVYLICQVLQVSRSAFYAYQSGESYQPSLTKKAHCEQVRRVFIENKRRYGSRRILAQLQNLGLKTGRDSIRAVMKRENLKAIQPKSFVPKTTDSKHGKPNSPNLLLDTEGNRLSLAQTPNQVWVSDITYLPLESGKFGYLATWMDLFSRMIVSWQDLRCTI